MSNANFGDFVRTRRLAHGLSLRRFCAEAGLDFSNWSKVERGRLSPPSSPDALTPIVKVLKLEVGSDEWHELHDLAAIAARRIPDTVYSDEELVESLPLVFRAMRGDSDAREQMQKILDAIKAR